jgi:hypothetical protein
MADFNEELAHIFSFLPAIPTDLFSSKADVIVWQFPFVQV